MPTITRNAVVPYTPSQMYRLVADIEAYPEFLPWCDSACIHEQSDSHQLASVSIGTRFRQSTFMTRNRLEPDRAIHLSLVEGPFRHLSGRWRFLPHPQGGCEISLDVDFEFASRVFAGLVGPAFRRVCDTLVQAFVRRAEQLHGPL